LKAALVVARAEVAAARAQRSDDQALIAHLKLQIEKLNRDRFGPRSERPARLLDQLELQLAELEASATEDEHAAEMAAAKTTKVASFTRLRPARKPFPAHLPREGVIVPGPRPAPAAMARGCPSWEKTSPRRWRSSPNPGR
jgi:transposase